MSYILVTGGAGYIGSHTCVELINAGFTPIIVDNFSNSEKFVLDRIEEITGKKPILLEGDCSNNEWLIRASKEYKIEGCIHFAAFKAVGESAKEPLNYFENNIGSTISVLRWMEASGCKNLVFSSSCTVYGQPDILPVTEESPKKPAESPYGRTKQMCEDIIEDYFKSEKSIQALSLRYFNPIGAHPSALIGELPIGAPNNLVPFITETAAGKRKELTVFGDDYNTEDGTCVRDYIHVVDLARAHVSAIQYLLSKSETFVDYINVGTGHGKSVLDVIKTFEKVNNLKLNYKIGKRRQGDVEKVYADATYIQKTLDWKAELTLEDALRDAWKWQRSL